MTLQGIAETESPQVDAVEAVGLQNFMEAAAKLRGCRARTGLTGEQGGSNKPSCSDEENIWHCLSRLLGPAPQASHFFNLAVQPDR